MTARRLLSESYVGKHRDGVGYVTITHASRSITPTTRRRTLKFSIFTSVAQELRCVKLRISGPELPMYALFASGSINLTGKQAVSSARSLKFLQFDDR